MQGNKYKKSINNNVQKINEKHCTYFYFLFTIQLSSLVTPKTLTKDRSCWVYAFQAELHSDLCRELFKDTKII